MQKTFIGLLLLILVVVFFALENTMPVKISLWYREVNSNIALIIFLSVTFGAIVSFLLSLPARFKRTRTIREKDEKIGLLEDEIVSLSKKLNVPPKEVIEKNENKTENEERKD